MLDIPQKKFIFIIVSRKVNVKVIDKDRLDKSNEPNIENKLNKDARKRDGFTMYCSMDTVEYDSDESGTTVTMTKKKDNE